jgi:uncharacterized protein (DUF302 family)
MKTVNFKKEIDASMEEAIERTTKALLSEGFGVLTRIDFHQKVKEKLSQEMRPLVILGACNPKLAYEAYLRNADVTGLLPCNAVVREVSPNRISVEIAKASAVMGILDDVKLNEMAAIADQRLQSVLEKI